MLIHREFSSAYPAKFIIEKNIVHTENANKPNGYGAIDALSFSPYPKNPNIAKFFREIGLADELGSGVKNVNHYLKIYSGGTPEFIEAVGAVMTYGAKVYGEGNYKKVEPKRYRAALMRHICKWLKDPHGIDDDSGLPHLYHIACNVAFLLELDKGE